MLANCLYCKTPLADRYCPVCEPKHFVHIEPTHRITETEKGRPRKPGEWRLDTATA